MKEINRVLTVSLATVFMATSALASDPCKDAKYREMYPEKCKKTDYSTAIWLGAGGLGLIGGAVALMAMGNSGGSDGSSSNTQSHSSVKLMATMPVRLDTWSDIDVAELSSIKATKSYSKNSAQFDDIMLAHSMARGYTGVGSNIAIIDTDPSQQKYHGHKVANIAQQVAPGASVNSYVIADGNENFISYREIGNVIAGAKPANIYNNSWNMTSTHVNNITSREQITRLTDKNFVNALVSAAQKDDAIFVWAAGNDSKHNNGISYESGALSALPLFVPELRGHFINVVAWDDETHMLADYSNICGATKEYCLTAPGNKIHTDYALSSNGTSFAAPIVSGAVAIVREAAMKNDEYTKNLPADIVTSILFDTAADLGDAGVDEIYGHGMLDLEAATRPVGIPKLALQNGTNQDLTTITLSGPLGEAIQNADLKMAYFDDYGRAFETNLNSNINFENRGRGFDRLRRNDYIIKIGNLEFGSSNINLLEGMGFLQTDQTKTLNGYIAANNSFNIGQFSVFGRAQIGRILPTVDSNSIINNFSNVYTASATIGTQYKDWKFEIAVPETIISGNMNIALATGRAANGNVLFTNYDVNMVTKPAFEYTLSYKNISAGFVDNPYGKDEIYVLAKTRLVF